MGDAYIRGKNGKTMKIYYKMAWLQPIKSSIFTFPNLSLTRLTSKLNISTIDKDCQEQEWPVSGPNQICYKVTI